MMGPWMTLEEPLTGLDVPLVVLLMPVDTCIKFVLARYVFDKIILCLPRRRDVYIVRCIEILEVGIEVGENLQSNSGELYSSYTSKEEIDSR